MRTSRGSRRTGRLDFIQVFQYHFGSFAKGRQTRKSDIDLILIQETDKRYFDRFHGILTDLHQSLRGRDIEVFICTPKEFESISERRFIQRAVAEGQVIYEC